MKDDSVITLWIVGVGSDRMKGEQNVIGGASRGIGVSLLLP